jgi:hypothetical protein
MKLNNILKKTLKQLDKYVEKQNAVIGKNRDAMAWLQSDNIERTVAIVKAGRVRWNISSLIGDNE